MESGPSRYCEFGFGPGGMGGWPPRPAAGGAGEGGACAKATSAAAATATATVRKDAVLLFMGCGPPPHGFDDYIRSGDSIEFRQAAKRHSNSSAIVWWCCPI